jgi:hypothetical protein
VVRIVLRRYDGQDEKERSGPYVHRETSASEKRHAMAQKATQRRGRKIAMTLNELDEFLTAERTCRVASVSPSGPHVTPLWFVWHRDAIWLYSLTRSQRWTDIVQEPKVAIVVDAGDDYFELRGAEITGVAEVVGETPRVGDPEPRLEEVERLFAGKYSGLDRLEHDHRHGWLKVSAVEVRSWDFRKIRKG